MVNSVSSKSSSNFNLLICSNSFIQNARAWILLSFAADTDNPLLCVCFITGLRNRAVWPNNEVIFQASFSDCSIPILCRLLLCTLPWPSCYSNLCHIYHTSSSNHLVLSHPRPSISVWHTRSLAHLGVSRLRLNIPTTHPVLPLPSGSGSYCVLISLI